MITLSFHRIDIERTAFPVFKIPENPYHYAVFLNGVVVNIAYIEKIVNMQPGRFPEDCRELRGRAGAVCPAGKEIYYNYIYIYEVTSKENKQEESKL